MPEFSNYVESRSPIATPDGTEIVAVSKDGESASMTAQQIADLSPGSGTVTSVSGTTDRITSTGGATPVLDIDPAYDATTINGRPVVDTTGTVIAFAVPQTYGSVASPETGNITLDATGLVLGMVQLLLHNHSSIPTFGSEFKRIGGTYVTSVLNSIYFHAVSASRIEYTVSQQL
jgi:hypothetical protein